MDINKLFYRLWRNIIIRNEILFHIRLYNIHIVPITVYNVLYEIPKYKLNGYLKSIYIEANYVLRIDSLPYGLEYIKFAACFDQLLVKGMIPDTVKTIDFNYYGKFNNTLDGDWLPPSLTSLIFGRSFQQPIKVGHLPNTLTNLKLWNDEYKGRIEYGALPKSLIVKSNEYGYYKFNSKNNNIKITNYSIPKSTTQLVFDSNFNQSFKIGDIPQNVTSLYKIDTYDQDLEPFVLPPSIIDLKLNFILIKPYENILPPNLTSLSIHQFLLIPTERILPKSITSLTLVLLFHEIDLVSLLPKLTFLEINNFVLSFQLATRLFPKSLTSIKFLNSVYHIPIGYFINHTNLKTLYIIAPENPILTLPSSLTHLELYFSDYTQYPLYNLGSFTSLTNLNLTGNFNTNEFCDLPLSLTSLNFGEIYNQPINGRQLPNNLKELYLSNPSFCQYIPCSIDDVDQLPSSLQSIIISSENHRFLNYLPLNFISKYIKLRQPFTVYENDDEY